MLGRQQLYLELNDETDESDDMTEIMSNAHLNQHFLALGREVRIVSNMVRLVLRVCTWNYKVLLLFRGLIFISQVLIFIVFL